MNRDEQDGWLNHQLIINGKFDFYVDLVYYFLIF